MQPVVKNYYTSHESKCVNNIRKMLCGGVMIITFVTSGVNSTVDLHDSNLSRDIHVSYTDSQYNYYEPLLTSQLLNCSSNSRIDKSYQSSLDSFQSNLKKMIFISTTESTAKVESEAYYIFGTLRQLTEEEKEAKRKSLAAISKPTGRNFFDFF